MTRRKFNRLKKPLASRKPPPPMKVPTPTGPSTLDAASKGLEELQETLAGHATLTLGDLEDAAELAFQEAVNVAELLLFVEADGVLRDLAAGLRAVLAGRIAAALERLAGAEDMLAEAAADAGGGAGITSHDLKTLKVVSLR